MIRLWIAAALVALAAGSVSAATVETHTATNGAARLVYLDQGHGPAVVMIPSLGRDATDFDDLAGRLEHAGFRVLRIQPRGLGGSTGPMEKLVLRDFVADVAAVIHASGAGKAVAIGHDDGNRVARGLAAYFPERTRGVILLNAGGKVHSDHEAHEALVGVFDPTLSPEAHLKNVATAFFAPGNDASVWAGGWSPATAEAERAAGAATPLSDWWTAGRAPILVVQARQDRIAPPANAEALKAEVGARAEIVYVEHAGHALLPEQPAAVADAVIAWLERLPRG